MKKLKDVTKEDTETVQRVFVVWTEEWDYESFDLVVTQFRLDGHRVINAWDDMPVDEGDLRDSIRELTDATTIALPMTWWTSATAHQLVQIAGWLGLRFTDHDGFNIPTASLRAA